MKSIQILLDGKSTPLTIEESNISKLEEELAHLQKTLDELDRNCDKEVSTLKKQYNSLEEKHQETLRTMTKSSNDAIAAVKTRTDEKKKADSQKPGAFLLSIFGSVDRDAEAETNKIKENIQTIIKQEKQQLTKDKNSIEKHIKSFSDNLAPTSLNETLTNILALQLLLFSQETVEEKFYPQIQQLTSHIQQIIKGFQRLVVRCKKQLNTAYYDTQHAPNITLKFVLGYPDNPINFSTSTYKKHHHLVNLPFPYIPHTNEYIQDDDDNENIMLTNAVKGIVLAIIWDNVKTLSIVWDNFIKSTVNGSLDIITFINDYKLLFVAAEHGSVRALEFLYSKGALLGQKADFSLKTEEHNEKERTLQVTTLGLCVYSLNQGLNRELAEATIKYLIKKGENPNARIIIKWSEYRGYYTSQHLIHRDDTKSLLDFDQTGIMKRCIDKIPDKGKGKAKSGSGDPHHNLTTASRTQLLDIIATQKETISRLEAELRQLKGKNKQGKPATSRTPCHFFSGQVGSCRKGDSCEFAHDRSFKK